MFSNFLHGRPQALERVDAGPVPACHVVVVIRTHPLCVLVGCLKILCESVFLVRLNTSELAGWLAGQTK